MIGNPNNPRRLQFAEAQRKAQEAAQRASAIMRRNAALQAFKRLSKGDTT